METPGARFLGLPAVAMLLSGGCGGGAPTLPGRDLAEVRDAVNARPGTSIGGIVTTKSFTVGFGKTVNVTKNVAIFASNSVTIDGTLVVPRGISVAFFTPSFTLGGLITTATNKKWSGEVDDLLSACHVEIQSSGTWTLGAGDNLGITSSTKPKSNPKKPCAVFVDNSSASQGIVMTPGTPGGTDKKRPNGENGGWIEIGSPQAIRVTEALAAKDKHGTLKAYPPDQVAINVSLAAGNGGDGKPDNLGTFRGDTYTFKAANGGIGGSVQIVAGSLSGVFIQAGSGGMGGQLMYSFDYTAIDGTASDPNGKPLSVTMGAGGGGGAMQIAAKIVGRLSACAGNGGAPSPFGSLTISGEPSIVGGSAYTGGYAPATNGTGNGGDVTLVLAAPGKKGPGSNPTCAYPPKDGGFTPISFEGGHGSAWLAVGAPAGSSAQGGSGGSLTLVPPKHVTMTSLARYGLSFRINDFGRGGDSLLACNGVPGIPGGNGGDFHDDGLVRFVTYPYSSSSNAYLGGFNGGGGSDGTPPGAGGKGGIDDEGVKVGRDGATGGTTC